MGPTMAEAHPNVVLRRSLRPAQHSRPPVDRPSRDQRVRRRQLHFDVLEEFSRFGIIAGARRGWHRDREAADG